MAEHFDLCETLDPFTPAYYNGHGRGAYWHLNPSCGSLARLVRRRGSPLKAKVGGMIASGRAACPFCTKPGAATP